MKGEILQLQGDRPIQLTEVQSTEARSNSEATPTERPSFASAVKDEMVLLGLLVMFVGMSSTEAYYSVFGLRYQYLAFSPWQLLYRGLTALLDAPSLLVPYLVAVVWMCWHREEGKRKKRDRGMWSNFASYLMVLLLLVTSYPLARWQGRRLAARDIDENTTTLPHVISMITERDERTAEDGYLLLLADSDYFFVFTPLSSSDLPFVERIPKDNIRMCMYGPKREPSLKVVNHKLR